MSGPEPIPCKFIGTAPYFNVRDVVKAAAFYRDMLGFKCDQLWGEPPCFCMPRRDGFTFMLSQTCDAEQVKPNSVLRGDDECWDAYVAYVWVTDAQALFEEYRAKGVPIVYEPVIRDYYAMKEFAIRDLDGYIFAFGQDWSAKK